MNLHHKRILVIRFLTLPFRHQMAVLEILDVSKEEDRPLTSDRLPFMEAFRRVAEQGLLWRLWEETEKHHTDPMKVNPFKDSRQEKRNV